MATAHPRMPIRKRVLCTLAATAAATLVCGGGSAIAAPNINLGFDAPVPGTIADKLGQGTGFTSVQPNKNGNQHVAANLDLAGGALSVLSTNGDAGGGSASSNNNTQQNALQIEVDGTDGYTVSTILRGPLPVATAFQSAGIFVGPDQDNYVKLAAGIGNTGGTNTPRLQLAKEQNGPASVTTPAQTPAAINTAQSIQLILTVTPGTSGGPATITASAVIDGVTLPVGSTTLAGVGTSADKVGIVTTHANNQPAFTTPYENFAVLPAGQVPSGPGGPNQVVAFDPKRTVIRGTTGNAAGQPGLGVAGFGQFMTRTLPTSLAMDPVSEHLYVATQFGKIYVFDLDADNNATLLNGGPINSIFSKPNTKFDGSPESQSGRQVTGIAFDPTPQGGNSVLYVTHSDPEIFEEAEPGQSSVDPKSGMLTRLVVNANGQVVSDVDLIKGLPRSGENHGPNGMAFGPDGKLYVALGGNTNNGSQSKPFGYFPETPMSASVIKVDTAAIGTPAQPLDVGNGAGFSFIDPCEAGESVGAGCSAGYVLQGSAASNGTIPGKVELFATGFRNPYDLVWHTNGSLYTAENEANENFGPTAGPTDKTPTGVCPGPSVNQPTGPDELFRIQPGGYHGHPNPSLGLCAEGAGVPPIASFSNNSSTTGLAEYTSNAFGNLLQGQLIAANYAVGDNLVRVKLSPDGAQAVEKATLASGFKDPLDILVGKDGAIFVAEHSNAGDSFAQISVLEPIALSCPKPGSPNIDSDGDGFLDSVEVIAGTDFCNPADAPADFDGDRIADVVDPDVDGDGVADVVDQLQRDPTNGAGTTIPFVRDFNQSNAGGWFGTGFGGVQLSSKGGGALAGQASAGGAGGFLSITATGGTHEAAANNQHNAFQHGFHATAPVEVSTVVTEPFANQTPQGRESSALYLGPNEDNFIRLAVHANGGSPVVELGTEQGGVFTRRAAPALPLPASKVTLLLNADPSSNRVRVRYRLGEAAVQTIGTLTIPASWFQAPILAGLATTKADSPKASISFIFDEFAIGAGTPVPPADQGGDPELPPPGTPTTPTTPTIPKPPTGGKGGKVKLTIGQMRINQRISAAAIRRVARLEAFLEGKPAPRFQTSKPAKFQLTIGQMAINQRIAQAAVRRVDALAARLAGKKPATPRRSSGNARFTLTATQMLINQRISQAAVRRVNALQAQVDAGARLP